MLLDLEAGIVCAYTPPAGGQRGDALSWEGRGGGQSGSSTVIQYNNIYPEKYNKNNCGERNLKIRTCGKVTGLIKRVEGKTAVDVCLQKSINTVRAVELTSSRPSQRPAHSPTHV